MRSCFLEKIFNKNRCIAGLRNYFFWIILAKKQVDWTILYIFGIIMMY
ncbi:Ovule protein [Flavobacterium branchiophilum]